MPSMEGGKFAVRAAGSLEHGQRSAQTGERWLERADRVDRSEAGSPERGPHPGREADHERERRGEEETDGAIFGQFLIEAMSLSLVGGLFGAALGYGITLLASQ